jgi:hypothetical protein
MGAVDQPGIEGIAWLAFEHRKHMNRPRITQGERPGSFIRGEKDQIHVGLVRQNGRASHGKTGLMANFLPSAD